MESRKERLASERWLPVVGVGFFGALWRRRLDRCVLLGPGLGALGTPYNVRYSSVAQVADRSLVPWAGILRYFLLLTFGIGKERSSTTAKTTGETAGTSS